MSDPLKKSYNMNSRKSGEMPRKRSSDERKLARRSFSSKPTHFKASKSLGGFPQPKNLALKYNSVEKVFWEKLECLWAPTSKASWIAVLNTAHKFAEVSCKYPIPARLILDAAKAGKMHLNDRRSLRDFLLLGKDRSFAAFGVYNRLEQLAKAQPAMTQPKVEVENSRVKVNNCEVVGAKRFGERLVPFVHFRQELLDTQLKEAHEHCPICLMEFDSYYLPLTTAPRSSFEEQEAVLRNLWTHILSELWDTAIIAAISEENKNISRVGGQLTPLRISREINKLERLYKKKSNDACVKRVKLACGHEYGLDCITTWFKTTKSTTCCLCRREIGMVPLGSMYKMLRSGPDGFEA